MFRFKYLSVVVFAAALAGVVVSCDDKDKVDTKAEGIVAGNEMCACVASYEAPAQPQHPESPLPPADFDFTLDYSDPEVLAGLNEETISYLMNPAIIAYFGELAAFAGAFAAYAGDLYACLGVIQKYQEYATANANNYNPEATDPLLSVFTFSDEGFKEGFKEGVKSCSDAFDALFALMQQ